MPTGLIVLFTSFGVLFFLAHLVMFVARLRRAESRCKRIEAGGVLVPGAVGLLMVAALHIPPVLAVILAVLGVLLLIVGQGVYELLVFRLWRQDGQKIDKT